jgi:hypothetical protein
MLNFNDDAIRTWLRRLGLEGKIISIDELGESIYRSTYDGEQNRYKGFAVITAHDNDDITAILRECPGFDFNNLQVYKMI